MIRGQTAINIFLLFVVILNFITESQSLWSRRRRRGCSPVNCQISHWSSWSPCSAWQCGTYGNQQRTRHVITHPSCGGADCPSNIQENRVCYGNTPINCQVSSWSSWSPCSAWQCGTSGNQQRTRHVITHPSCGGADCPSNIQENRVCYGNTPINCQVSSWSSWSVCSTVQCGKSGFEQRSLYIIRHSNCGGTACPSALQETRICYGTKASACVYSTWSTWSLCPAFRCGDTQTRSRQIVSKEQCGGTPCNIMALSKARPCKQTFCINQGTLSVDGKCYCKSGFHGSCCQYSSKYIWVEKLTHWSSAVCEISFPSFQQFIPAKRSSQRHALIFILPFTDRTLGWKHVMIIVYCIKSP